MLDEGYATPTTEVDSPTLLPMSSPSTEPEGEPDGDSYPVGACTQAAFNAFVDSSQMREAELGIIPTMKRHIDLLEATNQSPSNAAAKAGAPIQAAEDLNTDEWSFEPNEVPDGATEIWCVRRGLVPGFHFEEPYLPLPSQLRSFNEHRCESFQFRHNSVAKVVA